MSAFRDVVDLKEEGEGVSEQSVRAGLSPQPSHLHSRARLVGTPTSCHRGGSGMFEEKIKTRSGPRKK